MEAWAQCPSLTRFGYLAAHSDQWLADLKDGRIGFCSGVYRCLAGRDDRAQVGSEDSDASSRRTVAASRELIRAELGSVQDPGPESRVKLALTAAEARANELASELLAPAIKELTAQEWLEAALTIAADLGEAVLEAQCAAQLESLFPESHHLQRHR